MVDLEGYDVVVLVVTGASMQSDVWVCLGIICVYISRFKTLKSVL